ncbi:MAG: peptidoglycan D,D-transpeptidase FtsI family protein [Acidimicrobiales bacterium]
MNRQIRWLGAVLVGLFLILFANLNKIQVIDANALNHHPGNTRRVVRDFSQPRGTISSADGALLAESVPTNDAFREQRRYPEGALFAHVVGYFSFTFGNSGVEETYGRTLAGRTSGIQFRSLSDLFLDKPRTGNLTLTLSKKVQQVATQALSGRKGAVVALDPKTGGVLALADVPSFDPNPLAGHDQHAVRNAWNALNADPARPLLPRAYAERYPPGSAFKVVTASAALGHGSTDSTPTYPVLTELPLPQTRGQVLRNFAGESCGGSLRDAFRVSCNTTFAQIGLDLGAEALSSTAQAFGFDHRPPLDVADPKATTSQFPPATAFAQDRPALAKSAIGQQDVFASPLQMALVAAGVANGGVVMTPQVVAMVRDSEGRVISTLQPKPWTTAISASVASTMKSLMLDVVSSGTGTAAQIPNVSVAGKTGTAQTGRGTVQAWFVAFAPAEDPKVAVAVVVEDQPDNGEATGGAVAAPIAKAVIQAALAP